MPRSPTLGFHPCSEEDAEQLVALRIAAMRESLEKVGRFDLQRARERFLSSFEPGHTQWILCDGQTAGFMVVKPQADALLLDHLYIHPDFQNRRLGAATLQALFSQADMQSLPIHVGALRGSAANRFYQSHGFVQTAESEWDIHYTRSPLQTMKKITHVAAAVITRPDGAFLLGQRAPDTFYPGYWEFPGGKVEAGETPREALVRELREELAIEVETANPWLTREHVYEHAHVHLHFFEVSQWRGEPNDHVHSALAWQQADALEVGPMLPANGPILKALRLPRAMGVTQASQVGVKAQLAALDRALANGLKWVQVREPDMPPAERAAFIAEVEKRCAASGALCSLNAAEIEASAHPGANLHLPARLLMQLDARPEAEWVGASCHTRAELEKAAALGLDYALLGHVQQTPSHAGQPDLGWVRFAELCAGLPMPVLAIGGLTPADMTLARAHGAHGMAMIRGAWA